MNSFGEIYAVYSFYNRKKVLTKAIGAQKIVFYRNRWHDVNGQFAIWH